MVDGALLNSLELERDDAIEAVLELVLNPTDSAILAVTRSVHQIGHLITALRTAR